MSRPIELRIDRLVLPATERHRADAFRAALARSLGAELGTGDAVPSGEPSADRAARAIADRARKGGA